MNVHAKFWGIDAFWKGFCVGVIGFHAICFDFIQKNLWKIVEEGLNFFLLKWQKKKLCL